MYLYVVIYIYICVNDLLEIYRDIKGNVGIGEVSHHTSVYESSCIKKKKRCHRNVQINLFGTYRTYKRWTLRS